MSDDDNMSDYEDFLLVEETFGRVISPVIYKKWLIPGENAYWHPGSRSDYTHMNTVEAKIEKNAETETIKDSKGRLMYPWRKVQYNEILVQGNDSRHLNIQRKVYSESEESDRGPRTTKTNVSRDTPSSSRVTSQELKASISGFLSRSKDLPLKRKVTAAMKTKPTAQRESVKKIVVETVESETQDAVVVKPVFPESEAASEERLFVHTAPSASSLPQSTMAELLNTQDAKTCQCCEKLLKDMEIIKKRTEVLPIVNRTIAELVSQVAMLSQRTDVLSRAPSSSADECSEVIALLRIQTESAFDLFQERLKTSPEFRHEFNTYMRRIMTLNRGCQNENIKVQRLCRAIFNENITKFGNWSGVKKMIVEGKIQKVPCRAFKDEEIFKMIIDYVGSEHAVHEWIRNTNSTRIRYHQTPSKTLKTSVHNKSRSSSAKKGPSRADTPSEHSAPIAGATRQLDFQEF